MDDKARREPEKNLTFDDVIRADNAEERERLIGDLISVMSLDEKIGQMSGNSPLWKQMMMLVRYNLYTFDSGGNKRLGIPPIKFTDGPRGIALNRSTCFPVSTARGAAWDSELEKRVGDAIGIEARDQGANFFGGVCINLISHPSGGRAQECFGEDPYHSGVMGVAMINGLQKHVMACAKHYACNNIEESRFFVDVGIDERTLREIYLPHFKMCADAGAASFMSAYNIVNGDYCGHNGRLLRSILKEDWKFDGFVVSDFVFGVRDGEAAADGGLDIEMPFAWRYGRKLKRLVKSGKVSEETIDDAVRRILRQKARFFKVGEPAGYGAEQVASPEHARLALEVAQKGIVLLKNENSALPLDMKNIGTLAVMGKLADKANIGDKGSSRVRPPYVITPLKGIKNRAGNSIKVVYYYGGADLDEAGRIAEEADAVIVVAGVTWKDEGEFIPVIKLGGDRTNLDLPGDQQALIAAVAGKNERCIVVLEAAGAITMETWRDKARAILMAWYPGMEGGNAIADILFGDVNPSGKLPVVFPKSADQLPPFDNKAKKVEYGYYHGYRLFDKNNVEPAFPFGFGLSYTEYKYDNLRLSDKKIKKDGNVEVTVDVTNAGKAAGEEIVQLYIGYNGASVDRPVKELKGFTKLSLNPNETKTASIEIKAEDLAYYDAKSNSWIVEEIEYIVHVGPSSEQETLLSDVFIIEGS